MKQILIAMVAAVMLLAGGKELRMLTLTPTPQMHCQNCENKIKSNLRFEKGVVKIETSVEKQTVVITYDGAKTDAAKLQAAMKKIGYETKVVSDTAKKKEGAKSR